MKPGWGDERPLLVIKDGDGYQTITGCHRAFVAKELTIPIPVVIIPTNALTKEQRETVLSGDSVRDFRKVVYRCWSGERG